MSPDSLFSPTLFFVLGLALLVQVYFFFRVFYRVVCHQNLSSGAEHSVSVVVCSHNNLEGLKILIPALINQKHRQFEIIIVDDRSTDKTSEWLHQQQHQNLIILNISQTPQGWSSKKYALDQGIRKAKYPILLLTDSDCMPCSNQWIKLMTAHINTNTEATIGYSPYTNDKSFLNLVIRHETLYTAAQYLGWALHGLPYMGVGRNIAYTKQLYLDNQARLNTTKHLLGGDDDLFSNHAFQKTEVFVQLNKSSFVYSTPKKTYRAWYYQKLRHMNVGKFYKLQNKIRLATWYFSQFVFYACSLILLSQQSNYISVLLLIIVRTLLLIYIFVRISHKLGENIKWYWIPFLDIVYTLNYTVIGLSTFFIKLNKWN